MYTRHELSGFEKEIEFKLQKKPPLIRKTALFYEIATNHENIFFFGNS
jgi:hypothetical protein